MTRFAQARFLNRFTAAELPDGTVVRFTPTEQRLLEFFDQNRGETVTRSMLLEALHEKKDIKSSRSIDFMINRLRLKLKDDPKNPRHIATHYGRGYEWLREKVT